MANRHPTSDRIFKFMDETKYSPGYVAAVLRLFIADEYDRDPTVLVRLNKWLDEMSEAIKEQEKYAKQIEEWEREAKGE